MSIPKEPRQIMINLMYLVLTAMLALNVSNEILHAFKIINASITRSNQSIAGTNNQALLELEANQHMKGQEERVKPYNDKAKLVHTEAEKVYTYLESWKKRVIEKAGGFMKDQPNEIKREDNIDASTVLLVEEKRGDSIKSTLQNLRDFMLSQVRQEARTEIGNEIPLQIVNPAKSEDNRTGDWSRGTFYNVPVLGVVTLLSKMQNDVRNSEARILKELFTEASATQIKFDAITAIAVPKTSYALAGQQVEAQIMLAAYNKTVSPVISASSGSVKVQSGVGTWTSTASGVGMQTVRGQLSLNLGDRTVTEPWSFQYMVGSAGASVQLDKMNVFYIGVPNPITVTAAGYSLEDVSISIPGATLTPKGKGTYDVMVTAGTGQKVTASIMAKTAQGMKQVGAMEVRVKRIPDPVAKIAGKIGGTIPANVFRSQLGIAAVLENFDFDAKYQVVSFEVGYQKKRTDYQGPFAVNSALFSANPQAAAALKTLAAGDRVYFDNIRAKGPDGTLRALNSIAFLLN